MTAIGATLRLRSQGALTSRAARGDAAAFAAVYERHHQALYRYCRSILRHEEDAQDALQSTMTRAFAALQEERRDFELRPWLFRIAHNEAVTILRRRKETTELDDVEGAAGELDDRISDRETLRLLALDLADLPERQRAALVLRELNGLSHAEIGIVLELTPVAVKQTIFEARSALFTCREGREMPCDDIRRMLSDGDGRVLRGRGVRAHLRTCAGCRRFRADLGERPQALRMLAPPLPLGSAAALLSQLLGAGTTAKLVACVVIAGGSTTLAATELHRRAEPPASPAAVVRVASRPNPQPAPIRLVSAPVGPTLPGLPQSTTPARTGSARSVGTGGTPAERGPRHRKGPPSHAIAVGQSPAARDEKASRRAAQERAKEHRRAVKERAKADRRAAQERAKASRQAAAVRAKADRRAAKEHAAADRRAAKEHAAADRRAAKEHAAADRRAAADARRAASGGRAAAGHRAATGNQAAPALTAVPAPPAVPEEAAAPKHPAAKGKHSAG